MNKRGIALQLLAKWLVVVAAASSLSSHALGSPLELDGLTVGQAATADAVQVSLGVTCGEGYQGTQVCNGITSYADHPAEANVVIGADGVVDRIFLTIDHDSYEDTVKALRRKFGPPRSSAHPVVQNEFGASFQQEQLVWYGARGTQLYASRYATDIDHATILLTTKRGREDN
ncbi:MULTISPECIES: hypothetical protein [Paraburkholderia]|uniref:Uncharacterized protein n=1 Tax=Paraburkholderia metrosideri TaxID=580937 RepID=A0ABW9E5C1_9BURK